MFGKPREEEGGISALLKSLQSDEGRQKIKEGAKDFGAGILGMDRASGSGSPVPGRDDSGNYTETMDFSSKLNNLGQKINSVGQWAPGVTGSLFSAGEIYKQNKDRVPNIIGNIAKEYGDPRLAGLQKLQDPNRDFDQDLQDTGTDMAMNLGGRKLMKTVAPYVMKALVGAGGLGALGMLPATLKKKVKDGRGKAMTVSEALDDQFLNKHPRMMRGNTYDDKMNLIESMRTGGAFPSKATPKTPVKEGGYMSPDEIDLAEVLSKKILEQPSSSVLKTGLPPIPRGKTRDSAGNIVNTIKQSISDKKGMDFLKRRGYSE